MQDIQEDNKVLRVAHIIGKMCAGGVESVVFNYYRAIDKSKIQFDFYYSDDSTIEPPEDLIKMGARFYKIPSYKHIFSYMSTLKKYFKSNNYKIIHSNVNTLSVFSLFTGFICHVPVRICHNHSTAYKGELKRSILKSILRPFNKLFATHYFACGELAGRWMFGNRCFDSGKVTVLNNAIDYEKFAYDEEAGKTLKGELGIPEDAFVVGHVGRFMYQKNHKFLIDVFEELKKKRDNAVLLLIGEGELQDEIRKTVHEKGLDQSVIFTGNRKDVNKLYSVMDVFCLPSYYEGMPVVLVEAQANSLQCIGSDKISSEAEITPLLKIIPIDSIDEWVQLLMKDYTRKESVFPGEFKIKEQVNKLENMYLSYMK